MRLFLYTLSLVIATWILILIGGVVNPMGASLACPDWYFIPTCNGEVFPEMTGGVLYEHGHRLWASLVGIMTVMLSAFIHWSPNFRKTTKWLSLLAVLLVVLQGTLGGVTVLLGLNAMVSTLHLGIAMAFFCLLIYLCISLYPSKIINATAYESRHVVLLAVGLTFAQLLLGGMIRHVGAGLACGNDWLACGATFWPAWHLGQIHMMHRFFGYTLFLVVGWASIKTYLEARQNGHAPLRLFAAVPISLVFVQVGLGLLTVATVRAIIFVVMHTAVGALVLASLFMLYWLLKGPLKESR